MHAMTQDNLRSAFGGESQAHVRYGIWAKAAGKEGFPNVERLFNCTAEAERVHGNLHFKALKDIHGDFAVTSMAGFGIGSTSENLQKGIDGETFEFTEMYPAFIEVAKMQGEDEAVKAMRYFNYGIMRRTVNQRSKHGRKISTFNRTCKGSPRR